MVDGGLLEPEPNVRPAGIRAENELRLEIMKEESATRIRAIKSVDEDACEGSRKMTRRVGVSFVILDAMATYLPRDLRTHLTTSSIASVAYPISGWRSIHIEDAGICSWSTYPVYTYLSRMLNKMDMQLGEYPPLRSLILVFRLHGALLGRGF